MADLPNKSVLVRTWFGDDRAWESLVREVLTPGKEGSLASTTLVNDPEFEGLSPEALKAKHPGGAIVSFLADEITLTDPEHPILAVRVLPPQDYDRGDYKPFRVVPAELSSVDTNINDANLDWEDFANRVDTNGIYRGYAEVRESEQSALISDWARRAPGHRVRTDPEAAITGAKRAPAPGEAEPDPLA
ncbi:hypothetical protein OG203_01680 [Nocardia sp. NBC_01499]|uniref:DUF6924 domain-containing protein n=1 Tax=Nocardia sp. NBC_01499 TaxID=2903597 RepID=UPI00386D7122